MKLLPIVLAALGTARAYCNSATPDGTGKRWGDRTSKAFPPGWNGQAQG
jgi:hypothetical protein